jgi:hypothetical protein
MRRASTSRAAATKAVKGPTTMTPKRPARKTAQKTGQKTAQKTAQTNSTAGRTPRRKTTPGEAKAPRLLSGGNPQIAKADGDEPVARYIAALPGWKRDVARWLDEVIVRTVPNVRKAVKWNSPFYGVDGQGWFLSAHSFTNYVKVAFFRGASLRPLPPGESKSKETRYLDIREGDRRDDAQLAEWVRQAAALPGWMA